MFRLRTGASAVVTGALLLAFVATAFAVSTEISAERIRDHIRALASDEFGGRSPGSAGEKLTLEYLKGEFTKYGYAPAGNDGTFFQQVPLVGITATNAPDLAVTSDDGAETSHYKYGPDFMCWTTRQTPSAEMKDAELVFVGYGVVAPEYNWDDYKDVDVRGKYIVMLVGDPPCDDTSLFAGPAMTYYGRWTYKYEIAAEKGAAGAVIIHNMQDAGYGWSVVENSWTGEQFSIVQPDQAAGRCAVESWVTEDVARKLFEGSGRTLEAARKSAVSPRFRPFALGRTASVRIENATRTLESNNVIARLEGNDPAGKDECIVYCAHWDHLGVGKAVDGDSIYNGALDNASGVAGMLETARAFAARKAELKRSIVFLIPTAEESGLLGASYYVEHPAVPLTKTVAMINVDGLNIWGPTKDMVVIGYGQSNLDDILRDVLAAEGRTVAPDAESEKGFYYRSDHFAFARKGVPALYSDSGIDVIGEPDGWGMEQRREYNRDRYHTPQDEYHDTWNLEGAAQDIDVLFRVGLRLATSDLEPQWSDTSEFKRIREQSLRSGQR